MSLRHDFPRIGIDAIALAVPRRYVELSELAEARGVAPSKYLTGLGTRRMAIAAPDEDPVTLGGQRGPPAVPARRARAPRTSGSASWAPRPPSTTRSRWPPSSTACSGCRARAGSSRPSTPASAAPRACSTRSTGSPRARPAAAPRWSSARTSRATRSARRASPPRAPARWRCSCRERPRLLELEAGLTGSYARDVYDFWRPLHHKEALVDGHYSVQCYLDALAGAYGDVAPRVAGLDGEPLARTCYHVPYGKMARKAHRHRRTLDGLTEQAADESFAVEVEPVARAAGAQSATSTRARCTSRSRPCSTPRRARSRASASGCSATARAAAPSSSRAGSGRRPRRSSPHLAHRRPARRVPPRLRRRVRGAAPERRGRRPAAGAGGRRARGREPEPPGRVPGVSTRAERRVYANE